MISGMNANEPCVTVIPDIKAKGYQYVGRYYSNLELTNHPAKVITKAEATALSAADLKLFVVWEYRNDLKYFTLKQGKDDAEYAYNYASKTIGQPFGTAIYFAVDDDFINDDYRDYILPYFNGVNAFMSAKPLGERYTIGVYGSGYVCSHLSDAGQVKLQWLANALGWTGTAGYDKAEITQRLDIHPPGWPFGFEPDTAPAWGFGEFSV